MDEDAGIDGIALFSATHPTRPLPWWRRLLSWASRPRRSSFDDFGCVIERNAEGLALRPEPEIDPAKGDIEAAARQREQDCQDIVERVFKKLTPTPEPWWGDQVRDPYVWISPADYVESRWPVRAP